MIVYINEKFVIVEYILILNYECMVMLKYYIVIGCEDKFFRLNVGMLYLELCKFIDMLWLNDNVWKVLIFFLFLDVICWYFIVFFKFWYLNMLNYCIDYKR